MTSKQIYWFCLGMNLIFGVPDLYFSMVDHSQRYAGYATFQLTIALYWVYKLGFFPKRFYHD